MHGGLKPYRRWPKIACSVVAALVANSSIVVAEGPTINWDAVEQYALLAVKAVVTLTGVLVFISAIIRSALAALRRQLGGSASAATAQREMYEAIEGPLFWLVALALAAWLPDILVAIGLLPQGTPFTIRWSEIFRRP